MTSERRIGFSWWRSFFWPIRRSEFRRLFPLLVVYTLICFNYSILRATKDALVVTADCAGAAVIPFIKTWMILPMALLMTYIFTKLFNKCSQEKVFSIIVGGFIIFFALFAFVLYPMRDHMRPNALCNYLEIILPKGYCGIISMLRNWSFSLFYAMAELWGTMVMSVMFWTMSNEIVGTDEAKRFYGALLIGANLATAAAGELSSVFTEWIPLSVTDRWGQSLSIITCFIIFIGLSTIVIIRWYHPSMLTETAPTSRKKNYHTQRKPKIGLREAFIYIAKSKYLICIAIIVLGFNIATNLVETIWKEQIRILHPNPNSYASYMGKVLRSVGVFSALVSIFISNYSLRKNKWTFNAMVTPCIVLAFGIFFFSSILTKDTFTTSVFSTVLGFTNVSTAALIGTIQHVLSRVCKFTFFDGTKEMAFVPLDSSSKLKGKSAIDGVGSRLGKMGSSIIHGFLLLLCGSVDATVPYVFIIFLLSSVGWAWVVLNMGRSVHDKIDGHGQPSRASA